MIEDGNKAFMKQKTNSHCTLPFLLWLLKYDMWRDDIGVYLAKTLKSKFLTICIIKVIELIIL